MPAEARPIDTARSNRAADAHSGAGMDRVIQRRRMPLRAIAVVAGVAVLAALLWWGLAPGSGRALVLDGSRIVISPVTRGLYEDFIPIRGQVTPRRTVYLDAVEGGRVEERLVEDGALVEAGQLLVVLSNTSLQLSVTQNEAVVTEQLNNMRTIELQLEQNRLEHKRNLVEIDYQITRLTRQEARLADLDDAGVAARSQLEDVRDELAYYESRRSVTIESQETDARLQETQLEFLRTTGAQLERNLALSRRNLDALNVRAPVAGKLSGMDLEIGQSIERGGRLGQIDDPERFKLRASIDEFYLGRVSLGQQARLEGTGDGHELVVSKIYPQVTNGQFEVDLQFTGAQPEQIRRGQTLTAKLTLGDESEALLIPNGAFYQDTGGNWMFVVNAAGTEAVRRPVRLGRRNARTIEVLDGLEEGERVVTSPYSAFREMDRLRLTND